MMRLRFAQPAHLIDLQALKTIKGISEKGGEIRIGALTTQSEVLGSALVAAKAPILHEAILQIADPQVRSCGTVGGNVANGDPGNDLPAVMMALNASYVLQGPGGERVVAARAFYKSVFETALAADEILTEIRIPASAPGHGSAYVKLKRKVGDYATAAAAVVLAMKDGACTSAAIALTNVAATPLFADAAAKALVGSKLDQAAIAKAASAAMSIADPSADMHGPVEYRKHMTAVVTQRAIEAARDRAAKVKG
jgi:carbon-monoxide dehydrogenase medium subunit